MIGSEYSNCAMRPRHAIGPLYRLRGLIVSNVWVLDGGPGDRWIIDTGHPLERLTVLAGLRYAGFAPSDFTGVLLTHRHSDHAGNAAFLRKKLRTAYLQALAAVAALETSQEVGPLASGRFASRPLTADIVDFSRGRHLVRLS